MVSLGFTARGGLHDVGDVVGINQNVDRLACREAHGRIALNVVGVVGVGGDPHILDAGRVVRVGEPARFQAVKVQLRSYGQVNPVVDPETGAVLEAVRHLVVLRNGS